MSRKPTTAHNRLTETNAQLSVSPPLFVWLLRVYVPQAQHHVTEQAGPPRSCSGPRSTPECCGSPRSTLGFSQCVGWLGEATTLWPFPCWTGETPSINPGPAGADRGQTLLRSKQARRDKSIVAATQELQVQNKSKKK